MTNAYDTEAILRLLAESKLKDLNSIPETGSKELDSLRDKLIQSASNGDIGGLVEVLENASSLLSEALNPTEDSKNE